MKDKNFLLSFTTNNKQAIKGKNPNPSGKLISSHSLKQKKQKSNKQIQSDSNNQAAKQPKKSQIVSEIQKLQKKLQSANQQIQQTQKKLDVDLFLKKQKQKRQQYAKDLDKEYEIQKKKREEKLYKKYRAGQVEDQQNNSQQKLDQKTNVKSLFPLQMIKVLQNQKNSISKSQTILNGHQHNFKDIQNDQKKLKDLLDYDKINDQQKQLLFSISSQNKQNNQLSTTSIQKIAQNMLNISYFPIKIQGPLLQPIAQYQNLMNCLTLMPQNLSLKYYSSKQINKQMYFLCKFYFNGQRKTVLTTDLIQTRQFAHYHINMHSKVSDNRNFGPTVIEKSFRKVSANYQNLDLRSSIYTLYGIDAQIIPITNKNYMKDNFQSILKFLLNVGSLIGFMNTQNHNSNIYQDRLYKLKEVLQIVQINEEQENDKKKKKKKKQKDQEQNQKKQINQKTKKIVYNFQNPYKGLVLDSKNLNKFQLLEVLQKFNNIILIRDYPKGWSCKRINLEIFSLGPLSMTSNQWTKNNQYNFHLTNSMNMRIVMRKNNVSSSESIISKQIKKQQELQTNNLYGFMIFHCKQGQQKITCMKLDSLVAKTKSNDPLNAASFCQKLQKGSYIIIPYSNKITKNHYQFFNLDFFVQKQDHIKFGKAVINQWKWSRKNNQENSQKVIQSLQSKQYLQKTKTQDIQIPRINSQAQNAQKLLQSELIKKLTIPKDLKLNDILIPGKIIKFLINPEIQIIKKQSKNSKNKQKSNPQNNNQQIQNLQKEQALHILLGYDILQGQDIDRGLMMEEMENNQQVFDFQHYGLGSGGLSVIMESLMTFPSIKELNFAGNDLDDSSIVFLCYYLQKGNRVELQELNIRNNNFGKIGMQAIKGLMMKFQKLHVFY